MKPHGHLNLKWTDDTLYVESIGPFNEEGAREAAIAYETAIRNRAHPAFSVIEVLQEDSVGPPVVMKEVERVWAWLGEEGCKSLALVFANLVQRQLADEHLPAFGRTFSSVTDAEAWVRGRNR